MEFKKGDYLITYYLNDSDDLGDQLDDQLDDHEESEFRIYVYSQISDSDKLHDYGLHLNNSYNLIDIDTVLKYKALGVDIKKCILKCFTDDTYTLNNAYDNSYVTLSFNYQNIIKFTLICKQTISSGYKAKMLLDDYRMAELFSYLRNQDIKINSLETAVSTLKKYCKDYYEYSGHKIHVDTKELYLCKEMTDTINSTYSLNLILPKYDFDLFLDRLKSYDASSNVVNLSSPSETYDTEEGRYKRLIITPKVDLTDIPTHINLTKMGLFNIELDITTIPTNLKSITHLYLENVTLNCDHLVFINFLSLLINLEQLSVSNCTFVTNLTITHINYLSKLTKIWCAGSGITDTSLFRKDITVVA
jgi:hypothetical protein